MKGDFSRDSFNFKKNFSRVLMQQGRVQLDADFNEQASILLHYLRTLTVDLIGPSAGPDDNFTVDFLRKQTGNEVELDEFGNPKDLLIIGGHYYVDGILCETDKMFNGGLVSYFHQPSYQPKETHLPPFPYLIYLDVWERHITAFEDESLYEVALGGIDTTTRTQVVWQIKLFKPAPGGPLSCDSLPPQSSARLSARTQPAEVSDDSCNIEPDARYRGSENQLYRVEIHTGNIDEPSPTPLTVVPTFKWSRENGSVVFAVTDITIGEHTTEVRLANLGRDDKFSLREDDWVELIDDAYTLNNRAGNLLRIDSIDRDEMSVTLTGKPKILIDGSHPLLRRWDQQAGNAQEGGLTLHTEVADADNAARIEENKWLKLEDGIQIMFKTRSTYSTGDYWLIPARPATGDVLWSKDHTGNALALPSNGIKHHYAALGIATALDPPPTSCRCTINHLVECGQAGGGEERDEPRRPESVVTGAAKPEAVKTETAKTKGKKSPR